MLHRKTRTHLTGASNLVMKTEPCESSRIRPCSKRDSIIITNTARDGSISQRVHTDLSPIEKSEQYYQHTGRILKTKSQNGVRKTAYLEENDKRELIFPNQSFIHGDIEPKERTRQESVKIMRQRPASKSENSRRKRDINALSIEETQLVGYDKYSADTVKNKVDLEKVREAKRVLRRRYANKTQLHRIYTAWDEDRKGIISLENMYNMSQKLGLNLNIDETKVLLASANKSGKGYLEMDEFMDLIYNKDDTLNLNLNSLKKNADTSYFIHKEELDKNDDNVIKKLQVDAEKMRGNRRLNQVHLVLKNKLSQIIQKFLNSDASSNGFIPYKRFEENIRQLGIDDNIVSKTDIKNLAKQYEINTVNSNSRVDYKAFIEGLKNFTFQFDEMYQEYKQPQRAKSPDFPMENPVPGKDFNIVDCRELPCNMIDNFLGKRRRVNVALKRFFPTQADFKNYVSKALDIDSNQLDTQPISQISIKNIVHGLFANVDNAFLKKRDFEGFVSSLIYNKHGYTNIQELSKAIYEEDENDYYEKITRKVAGQPPHADISGVKERKSVSPRPDTESNFSFKSRARSVRTSRHLIQDNQDINQKEEINEDLKEILQKIDNTVFVGTKKHFNVYKLFDTDKDGFVSHRDLETKISELNCLQHGDTIKLIQYLDPTSKGYVTFREFNSKIHPNMTQQDDYGQQTVVPSVMPSKRFNHKVVPRLREFKTRIDEMTKTFEFSDSTVNEIPSRFGASPAWVNTFVNFQPPSKSGMFISETERLERDQSQKTNYQREEKMKRNSHSQSRIEMIRVNQDQINKRIEKETVMQDQATEMKLKKKALEQALFERKAKLRNGFAF